MGWDSLAGGDPPLLALTTIIDVVLSPNLVVVPLPSPCLDGLCLEDGEDDEDDDEMLSLLQLESWERLLA